MEEKGKGVARVGGGGGVGTGTGTGRSMRKLCRNYPLATYPLKSARSEQAWPRHVWNRPLNNNSVDDSRSSRSSWPHSGHVRPRQGTEICNFGARSPLEALHWIFCFFSSIYVQFSKTSPLKSGESSEKSSGENLVKSCHVCGCHGFFGPDTCVFQISSQ